MISEKWKELKRICVFFKKVWWLFKKALLLHIKSYYYGTLCRHITGEPERFYQ